VKQSKCTSRMVNVYKRLLTLQLLILINQLTKQNHIWEWLGSSM